MRRTALLALAAAGCAQPSGQLPQDPLERATACTAVRALELSASKAGEGPVSFDGFAEVIHFSMLAAAQDGVQVDPRRLFAISRQAPAVMAQLEEAEWRAMVEPCNAAFPETQRPAPPLPPIPYEAGLTCFGWPISWRRRPADYPAERGRACGLAGRALQAAQPVLRERARDNEDAQRIAAGYAARGSRRAAGFAAEPVPAAFPADALSAKGRSAPAPRRVR
jgi:hypothetical protein